MIQKWLGGGCLVLALSGCTSPYKVHQLDDDEFVRQKDSDSAQGEVGINGKSEVEIEDQTSASHDLAVQNTVNTHLEDEVRSESYGMHDCNFQRTGVYEPEYDAVARLRPKVEAREDFGTDSHGELKHVHKEYYLDRVKAEQTYEASLRGELTRLKQAHADCLTQLAQSRSGSQADSQAEPQSAAEAKADDQSLVGPPAH